MPTKVNGDGVVGHVALSAFLMQLADRRHERDFTIGFAGRFSRAGLAVAHRCRGPPACVPRVPSEGRRRSGDRVLREIDPPLIVAKCQSCHGEQKAKAGLRLTDRESLLKGGESGPAVVPAAADESLLIRAVRYLDEPKMPPKQKLSAGEIAALERWVASGAPWPSSKAGTTTTQFRADLRASRLVGVPARSERAASGCRRFGRRGQ